MLRVKRRITKSTGCSTLAYKELRPTEYQTDTGIRKALVRRPGRKKKGWRDRLLVEGLETDSWLQFCVYRGDYDDLSNVTENSVKFEDF
jgi:hypothetical protein